jgi:hypothetical protein
MQRCLPVFALLALGFAGAGSLAAVVEAPTTVITSHAELETYLQQHAAATPLNYLTPGARERFLSSLSFNSDGVSSLDGADLSDELTQPQILEVLALFGARALERPPPSYREETQALEKRVKRYDGIGPIETRYNLFYRESRTIDDREEAVRATKLAAAFDARIAALVTPVALRRVDDHELRLLRTATRRVATATREPRYVAMFEDIVGERRRRELTSMDDIHTLQGLLLVQHRIGDARRLASEYRGAKLPPLPEFRDDIGDNAPAPTVWRLDVAGKRLTRAGVDLATLQIVVTASCDSSEEAAVDISTDPVLGPVFEQHALWLVLAPGNESIVAATEWNRRLPRAPVAMIYDRAEWSVLPDWKMPEFYFVRDGRVVDSVAGWWRESPDSRNNLLVALRRNGLMSAEAP